MDVRTASQLEELRVGSIATELVGARCGNCGTDLTGEFDRGYVWVTCQDSDCPDDGRLYDADDTLLAIRLW